VLPANQYGLSKLAMEYVGRFYRQSLPVVTTRAFKYTGIGHDQRFVIPKLVEHFRARAQSVEVGDIDAERVCNDVRFVVQAYLKLLNVGVVAETYNLCAARLFTVRYVINLLHNSAFLRSNKCLALGESSIKLNAILCDFKDYRLDEMSRRMLEQ
jgi:GDP-6-deoxy-D-talose 4-dehydrogenase